MSNSTTNNSFHFDICDTFLGITELRVIFTVVFDLIGGTIAALFSYHYYQGIEISHPVYSVIFSNLLYSTFASYASFVIFIIDRIWDSCIANLVIIWINSGCYFVYSSSAMTIAVLRYKLLVTSEKEEENEMIDMSRLRCLALILNWMLIFLIFIIRGWIFFPVVTNNAANVVLRCGMNIGMLFIIVSITIIVYYKMDLDLKRSRPELSSKAELRNKNDLDKHFANSISTNAWESPNKTSHSNVGTKTKSLRCHSNDNATNLHKDTSNSVETERTQNIDGMRCTLNTMKIEPSDYGGIYIGYEIGAGKQHVRNLDNITTDSKDKDDADHNDDRVTVHIADENISLDVKKLTTRKNSCNDNATLKKKQLPSSNHTTMKRKENQGEILQSDELNRIDVVADVNDQVSSSTFPAEDWLELETRPSIDSTEEYNDSKEHKSITKSILINAVWFVILCVFVIVIHVQKELNLVLGFIIIASIRLYRTFGIMLTWIFSFDLVYNLFVQMINNLKTTA